MRDLRLGNVSLIGRVVEEYRSVLQRVIHPANQLRAGGDRAGRIVWITEVNDVQYFVRNLRHETIGGGAGQIKQSLVCAGFVRPARVAGHHVGIDVNGIYRVHQADFVLLPEDVQNISAIAFRTVGDKDFIVGNLEPAIAIVILRDGAPQKLVTLLGAVSVKRVAPAHLIHRFMQGGNGRRRQRFGDITDATMNQPRRRLRIPFAKDFDAPGDFRKKIARFQFQIMIVQVGHGDWSVVRCQSSVFCAA